MVFLGDFNKAVQDLIKSKKFNFYRNLEVNCDKSNAFSWTAKSTVGSKGQSKSEVEFTQKEKGLGEMKCIFKAPDSMEIEASSKDTPLTKLKLKVTQDNLECTGEYAEASNWAAKAKVVSKGSLSISPDFSFDVNDTWTLGANAKLTDKGLQDYGFGLRYMSATKQHVSVQVTNQLDNICVAGSLAKTEYFGQIGAQVDISKVQSGNAATAVSLGGLLSLEDRANLRWRFDVNKKDLAMAYEYKFADNFRGYFSSSVGSDLKMKPLGMKFEVTL